MRSRASGPAPNLPRSRSRCRIMIGLNARREHVVVVNDEEQFSVWPAARELPPGWRAVGFSASREECLEEIARRWSDLRPASVRAAHEAARR